MLTPEFDTFAPVDHFSKDISKSFQSRFPVNKNIIDTFWLLDDF